MAHPLVLDFMAPIPVGHRVQILRAQRWSSPLFGGAPSWCEVSDPLVVDVDTGVVYGNSQMVADVVPNPLSFLPNRGYQVASVTDARVVACLVGTEGGERSTMRTWLQVEPVEQRGAYR